jgi:hypothetical protein
VYGFGTQTATMSPARWLRLIATFAALSLSLVIWAQQADARLKSEWIFGGGGIRALMALPIASSIFDDWTASGGSMPVYAAQPTAPSGTLIGLFNRPGLIGGFAAGFLGAGLLGPVFGHGMAGGLNSVASFLGLIFQLALVAMLARLIWTWRQGGKAAAFENLSPRQLADAYDRPRNEKLPALDSPLSAEMLGQAEPDNRPQG